jgi:hypothetical protein
MNLIEVTASQAVEGIPQEAINQHAPGGCYLYQSDKGPVLVRKPSSHELAALKMRPKHNKRQAAQQVEAAAKALNRRCVLWPLLVDLEPLLSLPNFNGSIASELCELAGLKKPSKAA